jgi:hypothetical protein
MSNLAVDEQRDTIRSLEVREIPRTQAFARTLGPKLVTLEGT